MRYEWLLLSVLLAACSLSPERSETVSSVVEASIPDRQPSASFGPVQVGAYYAQEISGDYAAYPELNRFVAYMVDRYGFKREYLDGLFSQARRQQWTLSYLKRSHRISRSGPSRGSWSRYLNRFLDNRHIRGGAEFWRRHQNTLQRAYQQFGVPPEYILGILAVETTFGGNVGSHRVLDALTTLAFDYPRRGAYFRDELENFLVMAGKEGFDPGKPIGSYAGAMGMGQFMPSSYLRWAVDFDGDGERDLWNPEDAIGSIANYFSAHGWRQGEPVVTPARVENNKKETLASGIKVQYSLASLEESGIHPMQNCNCQYPLHLLHLSRYQGDEYWLSHPNFYVITRYNHSSYYAMAVYRLAQAIKEKYHESY